MEPLSQTLINAIIGSLVAAIGFTIRVIWEGLRELQKADADLTARISEMQLLVTGNYVKKEEMDSVIKAMFTKLDRIEDKLDKKVDRS